MKAFTIITEFPVSPAIIYDHWLHGAKHTEMTGSLAEGKAEVGGRFTAWEGYIKGKNIELELDRRIVQSWRTTDFKADDPDSYIELRLLETKNGCHFELKHMDIPEGQPDYKKGWEEHYIEPMKQFFT